MMQSRQLLTGVRNLRLRPSGTSTLFADFYIHFTVVTVFLQDCSLNYLWRPAFHIEHLSTMCGLCNGTSLSLLGYLISRMNHWNTVLAFRVKPPVTELFDSCFQVGHTCHCLLSVTDGTHEERSVCVTFTVRQADTACASDNCSV